MFPPSVICAAVLLFASTTAMADGDATRGVPTDESLQRFVTVSPNAELPPIVDESQPAQAASDLTAEPAGLRSAGEDCYAVGGYFSVFSGSNLTRGNVFNVTVPQTLLQFSMELSVTSGQVRDLYFILYEKPLGGLFCEVFFQHKQVTGTGRAFYACDPVSVPLSPTKVYLAAVAWSTPVVFAVRTQSLPAAYPLGSMLFSTGKNNVALPGDVQGCPSGLPTINSELYSMRLCFLQPLPGDLDNDGDVDAGDFSIFLAAFGRSAGGAGFRADCDFDADGIVTLADYQVWLGYYREFIGGPSAEPPMCAPGDVNADGRVDLTDFAALQECLPAPPDRAFPCVAQFDFDSNGVVDLLDYDVFAAEFSGP